MSKDMRECLKRLEDEVDDDYIAHWEGNKVDHVSEAAKSAVVKAFMRVLHNLPTWPDEDSGDTFSF